MDGPVSFGVVRLVFFQFRVGVRALWFAIDITKSRRLADGPQHDVAVVGSGPDLLGLACSDARRRW